jgi:hypothetical protein
MTDPGQPIAREDREPWIERYPVVLAFGIALAFVVATRAPVARLEPIDSDEFGFLQLIREYRLPMHHTLFMASARAIGPLVGDPYRGFLILDMLVSALALTSVWWWLRALVRPGTAAAATLVLAVAPLFWAYGAQAGNYTAIPLVGSGLLGIAVRTWRDPQPWHPYAAAVLLALGTGYRQDIGTFWLPVFFLILGRHRVKVSLRALALFTALNLAWLLAMLYDVGGWERYRAASSEFAHEAGYLNSAWNLGLIDGSVRYAAKLGMAQLWTFGPGLMFLPVGMVRLARSDRGPFLAALLLLSVLPALAFHLLIHFGSPGYAFHYVPTMVALMALGAGTAPAFRSIPSDRGPARLAATAVVLAVVFFFYPTDYNRPGFWGDFDLSFARWTRVGLRTRLPYRTPAHWRTANSRDPRLVNMGRK